jgi:SAM-dependent methyltransferase
LVWTYRNTIGPKPKYDYILNWQAILYCRGPDAPPLECPELVEQLAVQDVNAPDGRLDGRYHTWQKPDELAERLIRHSTRPGELVLDPFAGTGTFLLAAARLGRKALGCDIAPDMLRIACERGCVRAG